MLNLGSKDRTGEVRDHGWGEYITSFLFHEILT